MPENFRQMKRWRPKGVVNRNRGLQRLLDDDITDDGVFYFGDDDNSYDIRLFEEVRAV